MEKPCNGRKNLVTGYSHGWSLMIIMRLSVRILQLRLSPPPTERRWKNAISHHFSRLVHYTKRKPSLHVKRKGQQAGAAASSSGSALTMPDSCSNECGVSLLGTAQLTSLPAALAAPQSTAKVTVSDFPIPGHCCTASSPPAVYAFHT